MLKKNTIRRSGSIRRSHAFLLPQIFRDAISQSPQLGIEPNPIGRVGEITRLENAAARAGGVGGDLGVGIDRHGVSGALMIASVPGDEESVASAATAFPDRIAGAFMFDPTKPDAESRARRAFDDLGLRVVCLFPAMHHYSMAENEGVRAVAASRARGRERSPRSLRRACGACARNSGCSAFRYAQVEPNGNLQARRGVLKNEIYHSAFRRGDVPRDDDAGRPLPKRLRGHFEFEQVDEI